MALDFEDVKLPEDIERGAVGGPSFLTRVSELESGFEQRNSLWAQPRGSWDISYGLSDAVDIDLVRDFFYARRGRLTGFRFKDWTDFEIGDPLNPTVTFQQIAVADGVLTTFNVVKTYTSGTETFSRRVRKIVFGTETVLVNGSVDVTAVVDVDNGTVTPTTLPALNDTIEIACEFDVPVRFNSDTLRILSQLKDVKAIPAIMLKELRLR